MVVVALDIALLRLLKLSLLWQTEAEELYLLASGEPLLLVVGLDRRLLVGKSGAVEISCIHLYRKAVESYEAVSIRVEKR